MDKNVRGACISFVWTKMLEELVYHLYGQKCKNIKIVRYIKFKVTYEKKNKIQDIPF